MPALGWLAGAVLTAIGLALTQWGRDFIVGVFYYIAFQFLSLLVTLIGLYKDWILGIVNSLIGYLPNYLAIPIIEMQIPNLIILFIAIRWVSNRVGL